VGFKAYGKTYEYFPLISKAQYRAQSLKRMLARYFDNSPTALVSYMVEETLSPKELQQLRKLLDGDEAQNPGGRG
jgi:predicted transcriptional regulator